LARSGISCDFYTMQALLRFVAFGGIAAGVILLLCGCAIGPKYAYTMQGNSAILDGFSAPNQGSEYGSCHITILRVDGFASNFSASNPGNNWPLHQPHLYLAPGVHTLNLSVSEIDVNYGEHSGNSAGITGTVASGSTPTITVEFKANHTYRLAGYLGGSTIDIALWDETNGAASRSRTASWTFDSNSNYSDSPAPSGNHR
jgi:hypothetical protein